MSQFVDGLFWTQYLSPSSEVSLLKGVPMSLRNDPTIKQLEREGCKVRYRGPRRRYSYRNMFTNRIEYDRHTLKENAVTFTVYPPR